MKRRYFSLALAALLTMGLLTGCGASSYKDQNTTVMAPAEAAPAPEVEWVEAPMESPAAGEVSDSSTGQNSGIQQKLIIRAEIQAETEDLDPLLAALSEQITALGGYTERQELHNGSAYSSYRYRSAYLTIRIPAESLDEFTRQMEGQSNVVSYTETSDDVTLTYVDTQSRMLALETEQTRLLELLSQADNMADLLEIEARLTDVRYELESVTSQLRVLDNQVNYATVELTIEQVKVYTEVEEQTLWQRIASGFTRNLKDMGQWLQDSFVWLVTYSPQLLLLAGAAYLLFRLFRRWRQNRKPRNRQAKPGNDQE